MCVKVMGHGNGAHGRLSQADMDVEHRVENVFFRRNEANVLAIALG